MATYYDLYTSPCRCEGCSEMCVWTHVHATSGGPKSLVISGAKSRSRRDHVRVRVFSGRSIGRLLADIDERKDGAA